MFCREWIAFVSSLSASCIHSQRRLCHLPQD